MVKNSFSFLLLFLLILSCNNRDRDNVFDPNTKKEYLDIGLSVNSLDSTINLSWYNLADPDYDSVLIFQKTGQGGNFKQIKTVARSQTKEQFKATQYDVPYSYFLKIKSPTLLSPQSRAKTVTTGPGEIWYMDTYLYELNQINYDMGTLIKRTSTQWLPKRMGISPEKLLMTVPRIGQMEVYDKQSGKLLGISTAIDKPYDVLYDAHNKKFWVSDSNGALYYTDTESVINQNVETNLGTPTDMVLLGNKLYIMDIKSNNVIAFNTQNSITKRITGEEDNPFGGLKQLRADTTNKALYILDKKENQYQLYKYKEETEQLHKIYSDTTQLTSFDVDSDNETIWIVTYKNLNSNIVQLTAQNTRYHHLSEIERPIDIKVNPYNGNVIIADYKFKFGRKENKLFHVRPDLSIVGRFATYGDPVKVYIE